uniref:Histidine phosphatase family protein n=1 Tax=Acidobacterium capsulatum TaxID=33075 RepID=A0A7V4XV36_9BACT
MCAIPAACSGFHPSAADAGAHARFIQTTSAGEPSIVNSIEPGSIHPSETPLLWLIRHGETEWSVSGAHTGKTDIPLTQRGREQATTMRGCLENRYFSLVLSSPRQRALETARLAGFDLSVQVDDNLSEWDYGEYEGRTTNEIRSTLQNPNWSIWDDIPPGGESLEQVALRAQKIIHRAMLAGGNVALFSHAHFLRILAAVWIDAPPNRGRSFVLGTGTISRLGFERETRVIQAWNMPCH